MKAKNTQFFIPTASILHQATRTAAPSGVEPSRLCRDDPESAAPSGVEPELF